jgi:hypothetical protein
MWINPGIFAEFFRGELHYRIIRDALPKDAKLIQVRMVHSCSELVTHWQSEEWEGSGKISVLFERINTISYRQWLERDAAGSRISGVNVEWPGDEEAARIEKEFRNEKDLAAQAENCLILGQLNAEQVAALEAGLQRMHATADTKPIKFREFM